MEILPSYDDSYLAHHGIKGMRWGVRRYEDANGHLTDAGKRRYAVQDARKYYKINRLERARENTTDSAERDRLNYRIRRVQTRSDRKRANLSQQDINAGREIVAKHRKNMRVAASAITSAATVAGATMLYKNPNTRWAAPIALAAGGAATLGVSKKLPYYYMENRRYKQVNPKGATKKGLTKRQQQLRKTGKVIATAALAGAAGYALVKSGAVQKAVDTYKNTLPFDKAVKATNAEQRANSSSKAGGYYKTKTEPSEATKAILAANQRFKTAKTVNDGSAKIRSNGKDRTMTDSERRLWNAVSGYANKANSSAKQKIKSAASTGVRKATEGVKTKLTQDFDSDDPRTYKNIVKNSKNVLDDGRKIMTGLKAVKNRDAITALSTFTPDIIENTNEMLEKYGIHFPKRKK